MPNYNQQDITGAQTYQRARQIVISNPIPGLGIPSASFLEEKVYLFDNQVAFKEDLGELYKLIDDFYESFPLLDPTTDLPIGQTTTYLNVHIILYSAYYHLAALRDYPIPVLRIYPLSAEKDEGNTGTTAFTFRVVRWGNCKETASVDWAVSGTGDNPANESDFGGSFPSGTLSFDVDEYQKIITVNVTGDTDIESDETFEVTLSNPQFSTIEIASATGTIKNED